MKNHKLYLIQAAFLVAAIAPAKVFAQAASDNETQELRKLVEQMRVQMNQMQAEIDQLKGVKTKAAPATVPTSQEGTIQTTQPVREGAPSQHVGEATAKYQEFGEDTTAAPRFDNVPLDPKYHGYFRLPGTQTLLKIGGYFKTDFIYDLKPAGNPDAFYPPLSLFLNWLA